jgi:hypothetical protein
MTAKFESGDWNAALNHLKATSPATVDGASSDAPVSRQEWEKREQFKVKVIEARVKLKLMRDRTDALKDALERYRKRREAMRA